MLKVFLFLIVTSCLILVVGYNVYDRWGLLIAFFAVILWNLYIYFYSDQRLYKIFPSQQMEGLDSWKIGKIVSDLASEAQISIPQVFIVSLEAPTAFSVGIFHRSILISKGLVEVLTQEELKAVLAHEIFHIKQLDTLSFGVGSAVMHFCLFWGDVIDKGIAIILQKIGWKTYRKRFFVYLFVPIALFCLRLIICPKNDYKADQFAISAAGNEHLAQALWKLESYSQTKPIETPLSIAHFFIVNPFKKEMLESHFFLMPSVENRIRKVISRYPI